MTAGVGIGIFKDYEEAAGIVRARSQHAVNPAWHDKYQRVYEIYSGIYERMKPVFDGIAKEWP
jgi:sugar (pentulose or hexulose) kinase